MASSSHRQKWWLPYSTNVSPFPIPNKALLMIYFIFTEYFPLVGNLTLGQFKAYGPEYISGSPTFHVNLMRALLVHVHVLGHLMLRGKREFDYQDQVKIANFILEINPCYLLPFPAHRGIWKQASTRTDKIHRNHRKSLLRPRKIVLIKTYIKCKILE